MLIDRISHTTVSDRCMSLKLIQLFAKSILASTCADNDVIKPPALSIQVSMKQDLRWSFLPHWNIYPWLLRQEQMQSGAWFCQWGIDWMVVTGCPALSPTCMARCTRWYFSGQFSQTQTHTLTHAHNINTLKWTSSQAVHSDAEEIEDLRGAREEGHTDTGWSGRSHWWSVWL